MMVFLGYLILFFSSIFLRLEFAGIIKAKQMNLIGSMSISNTVLESIYPHLNLSSTFSHENDVFRYRFHFSGMSHFQRLIDFFWELRQGIAVVGGQQCSHSHMADLHHSKPPLTCAGCNPISNFRIPGTLQPGASLSPEISHPQHAYNRKR